MLDLTSGISTANRRRAEQDINTYYRLFKVELQPEIDRNFANQTDETNRLVHRNKFLAKKLQDASDDVKEVVKKNRLKAGENPNRIIVWADSDLVSEEELARRSAAMDLDE